MDKQLYGLLERMSEEELIPISDLLDKTAEHCVMSDSDIDRLHSSVMRKAGLSMNNPIKVKRTKKKTAAIFLIAAAAISLCSFTAYKGIKYFYGNAFKYNHAEEIKGDVSELESTTQPFNGVVLKNTFKDIEFNIEGIVSDAGTDYALVTARKKDGSSFTKGDDILYEAGLQMCIPGDTEFENGKKPADASELYWGENSVRCEFNDDGSLSITMANTWKIGHDDYDVYLGFGDLFSFKNSEEKDEQFTEYLNNTPGPFGMYNGTQTLDEYNSELDAHKSICRSLADEYYEGSFIIKAHVSEKSLVITPEENDYKMDIVLSGMTCTIKGESSKFYELSGETPSADKEGDAELTLRLENGEELTEKCSYDIYDNCITNEDGTLSYEPGYESSQAYIGLQLGRYTDPYKVTEILINGKTLWKK